VPSLPPTALTPETLRDAVARLAERDRDLRAVVARFGHPPLWERATGFPTLAHIILEQQVSLASAQAAFDRLTRVVDPLTPAGFLRLDDGRLLQIGFSRQKARYVRELAAAVLDGRLDLDQLAELDDDAARTALLAQSGIGPWTATVYLLMCLRRPDAWPAGDVALQQAVAEVKALPRRPDVSGMEELAEPWRPWRAVAARILWHHYLSSRGRR
jgi:DNA-3-methyladenine glycosylase II